MAKKKSLQDKYFPIATIPKLNQSIKPVENPAVIKRIIQGAVQGAFHAKIPSEYEIRCGAKPMPKEDIQFVISLIESLRPQDCIEAALASQFAISYIRGLEKAHDYNARDATVELFRFGHEVLEALTKYRTKGAQLINVQYNHNQGQINNINIDKKDDPQSTIEVC